MQLQVYSSFRHVRTEVVALVCVCIYYVRVYMRVCMYARMCAYVHVRVFVYSGVHVFVRVRVYVSVYVCFVYVLHCTAASSTLN